MEEIKLKQEKQELQKNLEMLKENDRKLNELKETKEAWTAKWREQNFEEEKLKQ